MRGILLLACSATKKAPRWSFETTQPAIEMYDGPAYKIVRPVAAQLEAVGYSIWILSAKHGLIRANEMLEPYDQKLEPGQKFPASPFQIDTMRTLDQLGWTQDIFMFGSELYADAFTAFLEDCGIDDLTFQKTEGGIGEQLRELKLFCIDVTKGER